MTPQIQRADGTWQPAQSIGWQGSAPDYETSREGGLRTWEAYDEDVLIGKGVARTRAGLLVAIWRHRRKWSK